MAKAHLNVGMEVDGFVLEERLHRGGMAAIWRVSRAGIDFPIVMKAPFLDYKGKLSLLVSFEVEQMIMAELKGIHFPRFIANGDFTVQPYIVMEYIPGPTLKSLLMGPRMDLDEVARRGIAMAEAIGDLHLQHVVHLDLKPANILFRETGEAVLIDFGLSRHEHFPDLMHEQYRQPAGTIVYMAPEQLLRIRSDKRSDIFSLGVILYQMATGKLPFGEPGRMRQVRRRIWRDPYPPRQLRPEIGEALQEVILKCLEPLPDRRYATAEEVAFDLRHPELVEPTERASRSERAGAKTTLGRWLRSRRTMQEIGASATKPPSRAPIILVAVDLRPGLDRLRQAVLDAAVSVLANMPGARLACLNVMQTSFLPVDANIDTAGDNIHVNRIGELRAWAEPLQLPRGKITYHIVEARSISAGVLEFAHSNKVDHLVVGAPTGGGASRLTMQITADAPCTVTVVRATE